MIDDIRLDLLREASFADGGQAVGRRRSRVWLLKRQLRGSRATRNIWMRPGSIPAPPGWPRGGGML
jgi:hypothetical protein